MKKTQNKYISILLIIILISIPIFKISLKAQSINSLINEINEKRNIIENKQKEIDEKQKDIDNKQKKINQKSKLIADLQNSITKSEKKIKDINQKIKKISGTNGRVLQLIQKYENNNIKIMMYLTKSKEKIAEKRSSEILGGNLISNLIKIYREKENEERLKKKLEEDKSKVQEEQQILLDTQNQIQIELDKKQEYLNQQQEDIDELNKKVAEIEKEQGQQLGATESGVIPQSEQEDIMAKAGISKSDYNYVDYIITKESKWNYTANNSLSGAYGLCQALPGEKMATISSDWRTNPVTQMKWCDGYARSRYGTWANAYNKWREQNWW